jgi:16S rRNA (cytosine1402-N4)-methyltransferase
MAHVPVMAREVVDALTSRCAVERLIDGTLGAGGHTRALLGAGAREVLSLDLDPAALEVARATLADFGGRIHIVHASYEDMAAEARRLDWEQVDGILLDLGLSSLQLDSPERGFAFQHEPARHAV